MQEFNWKFENASNKGQNGEARQPKSDQPVINILNDSGKEQEQKRRIIKIDVLDRKSPYYNEKGYVALSNLPNAEIHVKNATYIFTVNSPNTEVIAYYGPNMDAPEFSDSVVDGVFNTNLSDFDLVKASGEDDRFSGDNIKLSYLDKKLPEISNRRKITFSGGNGCEIYLNNVDEVVFDDCLNMTVFVKGRIGIITAANGSVITVLNSGNSGISVNSLNNGVVIQDSITSYDYDNYLNGTKRYQPRNNISIGRNGGGVIIQNSYATNINTGDVRVDGDYVGRQNPQNTYREPFSSSIFTGKEIISRSSEIFVIKDKKGETRTIENQELVTLKDNENCRYSVRDAKEIKIKDCSGSTFQILEPDKVKIKDCVGCKITIYTDKKPEQIDLKKEDLMITTIEFKPASEYPYFSPQNEPIASPRQEDTLRTNGFNFNVNGKITVKGETVEGDMFVFKGTNFNIEQVHSHMEVYLRKQITNLKPSEELFYMDEKIYSDIYKELSEKGLELSGRELIKVNGVAYIPCLDSDSKPYVFATKLVVKKRS